MCYRLALSSWLIFLQEVQAQKENVIVAGIVERTTREYGAESQESV